jgi:hypothetical protein
VHSFVASLWLFFEFCETRVFSVKVNRLRSCVRCYVCSVNWCVTLFNRVQFFRCWTSRCTKYNGVLLVGYLGVTVSFWCKNFVNHWDPSFGSISRDLFNLMVDYESYMQVYLTKINRYCKYIQYTIVQRYKDTKVHKYKGAKIFRAYRTRAWHQTWFKDAGTVGHICMTNTLDVAKKAFKSVKPIRYFLSAYRATLSLKLKMLTPIF